MLTILLTQSPTPENPNRTLAEPLQESLKGTLLAKSPNPVKYAVPKPALNVRNSTAGLRHLPLLEEDVAAAVGGLRV